MLKNRKLYLKLVAMLLSLVMLIFSSSLGAFAVEDSNNPTNDCWRCDNGLSSEPDCIMTSRIDDIEDKLLAGNIDTLYCDQCKSSTPPPSAAPSWP